MSSWFSSFSESTSSSSLREYVFSEVRKAFFVYCWVIVDPPCDSPVVRLAHTARRKPLTANPPCS